MRRGNRYALWAMFWATLAAVLLMYGLGKPAQKYVRLTGGSNANSGATYALAWATFGHACSTAVANDTVNIAPGTWTATMGPSGGLNGNNVILHPLHDSTTFRPIPDSATPVLDGSNYANDGIVVLSLQHVNILNLRVTKCNYPVVFYNTDSCLAYGLNVYQNILQNNDNIGGIMLYSVTEDTSGYTSVETYSAAQGYDENSVQVYPVFTDTVAAGGRDFHLTETSPTSVLNMGAYPYSEGAPKSYTMIKK